MIDALGRGQSVLPLQMNLDSLEAVHRVAECDVIFGCVDTAEGRNLANRIAAYYLIPYIDVGVRLVADGQGSVETVAGAVNYCKPGGATLLERGAITSEQVRAEELQRTDPDRYRELRRQKYIPGIEEERPAVISINAFFAALAVNEFLARVHVFRNVDNSAFSTVRGDLCEFALCREPEEGSRGICSKSSALAIATADRPSFAVGATMSGFWDRCFRFVQTHWSWRRSSGFPWPKNCRTT